jgi:glycosyltransferase involved in cell wall biosynthesis
MTPRVVYLDHVARRSGGEIALARALWALRGQVDAHVIYGEDGPLVERLRKAGIAAEVLPMPVEAREVRKDSVRPGSLGFKAVVGSARYVWTLRKRLRELRPDLIHTNSLKAALYGGAAGRLAGIPVVWHIRDRIAPDYLPAAAIRTVRVAARILPATVIANSQATLATLPGVHRGIVVANTVVYDTIAEGMPEAKVEGRPFRLGVIGRLAPWKGQNVFIDAFAQAFQYATCEAWIVGSAMFGEDDYATSLQDQVERLGLGDRIIFRGFREDVWKELAQMDILVHCSVSPEPFGQVVVEGMAAGVPVIAADAGGPVEIITEGVDGILTTPGNVDALSSAMRKLYDDEGLREQLASAGKETALRYSPQRTASSLMAVYRSVLSPKA